ncbi:CPBP family intramembrane glutamic endopeptidase [Nocardia sp. NBC_01329]|uniref:CPBP family intramembrane glutamic endopeptidase n=1 Tax=Nocardia sp. NBC_01329 TaxID=2903594 RepID=UPI002E167109|nr:CPBP family intramembrane metalloprotease [Nocardia sp. NBC_01329]
MTEERPLPETAHDSASPVDFPYYNGRPVPISGGRWWAVMAACVAGFVFLVLPIPWGTAGRIVPAVVFFALPLAALAYVVPGNWKAIFGRVRGREIRIMLGIGVLNVLVTFAIGLLVHAFFDVDPNPAVEGLRDTGAVERIVFFLCTVPQLFGEELVTVLPLLALLYAGTHRFGWSRRTALVVAWVVTAVIFALLHLPTYDWNIVQCLLIIGPARLILSTAYLWTKNIWVSTGAHIVNDWILFGLALLVAGSGAAALA